MSAAWGTNADDARLAPTVLVEKVKQHARDHYEEGGWDILIECHSDAEILTWIGSKPMTLKSAIRKVREASGITTVNSRRKDIQGEIF